MPRKYFRCFLVLFVVIFVALLLAMIFSDEIEDIHDDYVLHGILNPEERNPPIYNDLPDQTVTAPIVLWWTPFTQDTGTYRTCGDVQCFFTVNRSFKDNPQTQAFLFYGTELKPGDLPVPRKPHHNWGLLHEESPKNNYLFSYEEVMELFNFTSTFRRESSYPISTQYVESIEWLESKKYFVTTEEKNRHLEELSPIIYTQSDCGCPSGRDTYTSLLMKHLNIDSYGTCLHNKDLPEYLRNPIEGMDHDHFYKLNAKYKFSLAFENGLCPDYMTEKLWRPLYLGSVPIILGSPKVKDFLPSNKSAIVVDDFQTVKELADYIKFLNKNDEEYNKYLDWKEKGVSNSYLKKVLHEREWSTQTNWNKESINFIEGFQCHVCKQLHKNIERERSGKSPLKFQATKDHYGCPGPVNFDENGVQYEGGNASWDYEFKRVRYLAIAVKRLVESGTAFSPNDLKEMFKKVKDELR